MGHTYYTMWEITLALRPYDRRESEVLSWGEPGLHSIDVFSDIYMQWIAIIVTCQAGSGVPVGVLCLMLLQPMTCTCTSKC